MLASERLFEIKELYSPSPERLFDLIGVLK